MANTFVQLPDDSANTGKLEDHFSIANGHVREAVVIGDPSVVANVAPVDATNGLAVDPKTLSPGASTSAKQDTGNTSLAAIDTNAGATTDAAVTGDNTGTLSSKLRGINKILADMWDSANHWLKVSIQNATLAVTQSGTWSVRTQDGAGNALESRLLNDQVVATDRGLIVNSVIHGLSSGGGGGYVDVKVNPSGALNVEAAQATAANLNATVVGTGTFATQATLQTGSNQIGHLEANQSVNLAQVAGSSTATGNGTAAGSIRVALPTDGTGVVGLNAGTNLIGKVAAGDAYDAIYNGATALTPKFAVITASASGATTVVAAVTSKKIVVTNIVLMSNAAVNVKFQSHVTPTDITGLLYLAANTGFAPGYDPTGHFQTVAGEALDINLSTGVAVGGWLKYIEV